MGPKFLGIKTKPDAGNKKPILAKKSVVLPTVFLHNANDALRLLRRKVGVAQGGRIYANAANKLLVSFALIRKLALYYG